MVAYNHAPYVIETLESIRRQTVPRVRVLIADDASPRDDTAEVIRQWLTDPPSEETDRQIDWLMVGRPASFKHPERLMERTGRRLLVGETAGAVEAVDRLQAVGVQVRDFVAYSELAEIYRQTRVLLIAADLHGGGERAIWEARSCGCEVELLSDNPKLETILGEPVLSHVDYAAALEEGITAALAAPAPLRTATRADFATRLRAHHRSTLATRLRRLRH